MGLDITYYVDTVPAPDGDARATVERHHAEQADGIEHGATFMFGKCERFRAGSYSGYGWFREELAKLAAYPKADDTDFGHHHSAAAWAGMVDPSAPFFPLINFSDCEGTIGPKTSARLAADFAKFQDRANEHESEGFRAVYSRFRAAFEAVANNGFVEFC